MRPVALRALAAAALIAGASPAFAAVTVSGPSSLPGTPLDYQIFGTNMVGNPVYGTSPKNNSPVNVTFDANTVTNMTINGGFAQIDEQIARGASPSWVWAIINPDPDFNDMKFAVSLTGDGTVQIYYLLAGGATSLADNILNYQTCPVFSDCTIHPNGSNINFEISGASFNGIALGVSGNVFLSTLKQMSYNPSPGAVPEPTTWAMMLLGFLGIGAAMRRRRKTSGALMQIA